MKYAMIMAASIAALSMASPAMAGENGDGAYVGVGGVMYDNNDLIGIQGTAGYNFAKYFGVEGVVSTGAVDTDSGNISVGVDSSIAGFGVVRFSSDQFSVYAKGGYHTTTFGASGPINVDLTLDGIAGGVGVDWFFAEHSGVRFEAVSYDTKDLNIQGIDGMTLISASYIYKF